MPCLALQGPLDAAHAALQHLLGICLAESVSQLHTRSALSPFSGPVPSSTLLLTPAMLQTYAVKRLVAGLESSRQAARQGFALGLALVLEQTTAASAEQIVESIEANLDISNSRSVSSRAMHKLDGEHPECRA